jgi:hypothetical protein
VYWHPSSEFPDSVVPTLTFLCLFWVCRRYSGTRTLNDLFSAWQKLVGPTSAYAPVNFSRHLFPKNFILQCSPLQQNYNCHLEGFFFNIMVLSFRSLVFHYDCPSTSSLVMHCNYPSSLLSFTVIALQDSVLSFTKIFESNRLPLRLSFMEDVKPPPTKVTYPQIPYWVHFTFKVQYPIYMFTFIAYKQMTRISFWSETFNKSCN